MKKLLVTFFIFSSLLSGISQDQFSLLDESALWIQERFTSIGEPDFPDSTIFTAYQLIGDTLINDKVYKKVYANGNYRGVLLEEDKRVMHSYLSQIDTILNFNFAVGDTAFISNCSPFRSSLCQYMILEEIDSVRLLDGSIRKRLNFYGYNAGFDREDFQLSWIDGIGSTKGLLPDKDCAVLRNRQSQGPYCSSRLRCYGKVGQLQYNNGETPLMDCSINSLVSNTRKALRPYIGVQLFPNPTSEELTINFEITSFSGSWSFQIKDLSGKVLFQSFEIQKNSYTHQFQKTVKGIYFVDILTEHGRTTKKVIKI